MSTYRLNLCVLWESHALWYYKYKALGRDYTCLLFALALNIFQYLLEVIYIMCVSGFIVTVEQRECDVNTDVCLSSYRHSTSHRGCFYFEGSDRKGCASACLAAGPSSSFQIRQLQRRWRRYESWCYRGAVGLSSARRKQSKPRR